MESGFLEGVRRFLADYAEGKYQLDNIIDTADGKIVVVRTERSKTSDRAHGPLGRKLSELFGPNVSLTILPTKGEELVESLIRIFILKTTNSEPLSVTYDFSQEKLEIIVHLPEEAKIRQKEIDAQSKAFGSSIASTLALESVSIDLLYPGVSKIPDPLLLRLALECSPCTPESLKKTLDQQFPFQYEATHSGIKNKLNEYRKKGFLVWSSGMYVATQRLIGALSGVEDRNSPDIRRALALAKRRW